LRFLTNLLHIPFQRAPPHTQLTHHYHAYQRLIHITYVAPCDAVHKQVPHACVEQ
jgi:hypothetical protein